MSRPLQVVAVSGNVQVPSRTLVWVEHLLATLAEAVPVESRIIESGPLAAQIGGALHRDQLPAAAQDAVDAIDTALPLLPVAARGRAGLVAEAA